MQLVQAGLALPACHWAAQAGVQASWSMRCVRTLLCQLLLQQNHWRLAQQLSAAYPPSPAGGRWLLALRSSSPRAWHCPTAHARAAHACGPHCCAGRRRQPAAGRRLPLPPRHCRPWRGKGGGAPAAAARAKGAPKGSTQSNVLPRPGGSGAKGVSSRQLPGLRPRPPRYACGRASWRRPICTDTHVGKPPQTGVWGAAAAMGAAEERKPAGSGRNTAAHTTLCWQ